MSGTRVGGIILIGGGALVFLTALLEDVIGIGANSGFGPWQAVGVFLGILGVLAGVFLLSQKPVQSP